MRIGTLALSLLATTGIFEFSHGQQTCIDNIADIYTMESQVVNVSVHRTYILCPQSIYEIGTLDNNLDLQGFQVQPPLPLRPNMTIQCGDTGRRDELCWLAEGDVHVDATPFRGISDGTIENVFIEGIVFIGAKRYSLWATKPGDITFRDCEWREFTTSIVPVFLDWFDDSDSKLSVTFEDCSFHDNRYFGWGSHSSLIYANSAQNSIAVRRTIFENNDMIWNNTRSATNSFLIETLGHLTVERTCFQNNKVGVSNAAVFGNQLIDSSVHIHNSTGNTCEFAAVFQSLQQFDHFMPSCVDALQPACNALEIGEPSVSPTESPADEPSASTEAPTEGLALEIEEPTAGPTESPTDEPSASTEAPTEGPTGTPSEAATDPTAPTGAPTPTPTNPNMGPDCIQFEDLPFTAKALQYCAYSDTTPQNIGYCGSGEGDLKLDAFMEEFCESTCYKDSIDAVMEEFCQKRCFISHTQPNEYVEYLFQTTAYLNLEVSARVASFQRKTFSMELVGEDKDSGTLQTDGNGWQTFEEQAWVVASVVPGNHILRVTFIDGVTNLCSVSIRKSEVTYPATPTAIPGSNHHMSLTSAPRPTPTMAPTVGSDCVQFEDLPFTAKALQYCGYSDTTVNHFGDCGSGEVDLMGNLDEDMEAFCQSSCYVSHTEADEYVEYLFHTTVDLDLVVSARVASFKRKTFSMELVGEDKYEGSLRTPGKGWQNFEEQTWVVPSVASGNHILRVTFIDGMTNLCSVSIRNSERTYPATRTAIPVSNPTAPTVGPDCIQFEDLPFTAKALQYCGYSDTTVNHLGDCGSGEVDLKGSLDQDMEEFCQSSCYISHTERSEYVEYSFQTNAILNLVVSARVASFKSKAFSMELVGEDKDSGTLQTDGNGYQNFEEQTWVVASVVPGNHILRVTFIDGVTNLCSVSISLAD